MSIDTQTAVRTVGLGESFGPVHALRDVTLDLESGSVLGSKSCYLSPCPLLRKRR
jgi:ABC-type sugar transport system ATPase subunit